MDRVGRALGPAPLAHDAEHAALVADLTVYIRQHHGESDLERIGCRMSAGRSMGYLRVAATRLEGRGTPECRWRACRQLRRLGPWTPPRPSTGRCVVVAPQLGDEILGAGGTSALLDRGRCPYHRRRLHRRRDQPPRAAGRVTPTAPVGIPCSRRLSGSISQADLPAGPSRRAGRGASSDSRTVPASPPSRPGSGPLAPRPTSGPRSIGPSLPRCHRPTRRHAHVLSGADLAAGLPGF